MILGEMLQAGTTAYSPWFERQADAAVFNLRVQATPGIGAALAVNVQTKNTQDADSAASNIGSFALADPVIVGFYSASVIGLKELVRYEYIEAGAEGEWVHLQMMDPVWLRNETMDDPGSTSEPGGTV